MELFKYNMCVLIISSLHYKGKRAESCLTVLQYLDKSSVICGNVSDPTNCTVTCNQGHMFDDGHTSRVYQCEYNDTFSTPIYKTNCLQRLSPTLKIELFVDYKLLIVAGKCIDIHKGHILENEDAFGKQVTDICSNQKIGNISFHHISSKASSFNIFTAYELTFENSSLTQKMITACAEQISVNTKSGSILTYARSIQCASDQTNITINYVNTSTAFCPAFYRPKKDKSDTSYCASVLPLVGVKKFAYVSYERSNVSLSCEVTFDNSSTKIVFWEHNGAQIDLTQRFNGSVDSQPSLIINKLTNKDSGLYICNARNEFGRSTSIPISLTVLNVTQEHEEETTDSSTSTEKDYTVFIAIGSGCGVVIAIVVILIVSLKRRKTEQSLENSKYTSNIPEQGQSDQLEYDGLKDNLLYLSSDQPIMIEGDYSVVNDGIPMTAVDGKSLRENSASSENTLTKSIPGTDYTLTTLVSESITVASDIQKMDLKTSDETVEHICPTNTENEYAVVNKKKQNNVLL